MCIVIYSVFFSFSLSFSVDLYKEYIHNMKIITLGTLLYLFKYFSDRNFFPSSIFFIFVLYLLCIHLFSLACSRFLPLFPKQNIQSPVRFRAWAPIKSIVKWIDFLLLVKSYFLLYNVTLSILLIIEIYYFPPSFMVFVFGSWHWMHCTIELDNNNK